MNQETNRYEKLANISYDNEDGLFRSDNLVYNNVIAAQGVPPGGGAV